MQPCVIITNSCQAVPPDDVIKEILEVRDLPEPVCVLPDVRGFPWHINTKYYEADVLLCALDRKSLGSQAFANSVNGLIITFDSFDKEGLKTVEQWYAFAKEFEAEVKILLCDNCRFESDSKTGVTRLEAETWCIENGFELVELNPQEDEPDPEVEDIFLESTGVKRILQALHAHMWPNLIMKETSDHLVGLPNVFDLSAINMDGSEPMLQEINELLAVNGDSSELSMDTFKEKLVAAVKPIPKESTMDKHSSSKVAVVNPTVIVPPVLASDSVGLSNDPQGLVTSSSVGGGGTNSVPNESSAASTTTRPSPMRDERIDAMLEAMDSLPQDSFEELFQNLNEMKSKAESLSPRQRKAYAEKMAIAFWKSMGGSESEVEGLSSDDDED